MSTAKRTAATVTQIKADGTSSALFIDRIKDSAVCLGQGGDAIVLWPHRWPEIRAAIDELMPPAPPKDPRAEHLEAKGWIQDEAGHWLPPKWPELSFELDAAVNMQEMIEEQQDEEASQCADIR